MIVLSLTTDAIQVILGGAVATSQLSCLANYRDINASDYLPGRRVLNTNGTTAVNLVAGPASATQRVVDYLSVFNSDTDNDTVTVRFSDDGKFYTLFKTVLGPGEKLEYIDGQGFRVINTAGSLKTVLNPSGAPAYGIVEGSVGGLSLAAIADPSPPGAGLLSVYAKSLAGRIMPKWVGPSGFDTPFQAFLAFNKIGIWMPPGAGSATVPGVFGYNTPAFVGTATARAITHTSLFSRLNRLGYVSAAAAGSLTSMRQTTASIFIGDGTGYQGFTKVIRFGCSDAAAITPGVNGARQFVGIASQVTAPTNVQPSTILNCIGVGHNAEDSNLKIMYGGTTAQTPIDLGPNFPANTLSVDAYELMLFSPGNQNGVVGYRVNRLNTDHVAEGTLPTSNGVNLPATNLPLSYGFNFRSNNNTALAVGLDYISDYFEKDF